MKKKIKRIVRPPVAPAMPRYLQILLALVLTIAILYFAKTVIVPLALAVLLTFVLTPLVVFGQRLGLRRVPAALLVILITLLVFGLVGWGVWAQVSSLSRELPAHRAQMRAKMAELWGSGKGPVSHLTDAFHDITGTHAAKAGKAVPKVIVKSNRRPVVVAPRVAAKKSSNRLSMVYAVMEPAADAGLVLVFVVFMLIKREDLRNRLIGLLGHGQLTGTTRVLVLSAERVSRLLLTQLCINACFGSAFGLALLIIGVPYWFLWGFLAMLLRFIPYVGTWIAASMPILLSFAISPGWVQPLLVLGVFAALDLTTSNAVEPLLFGHSAGVSPVALLVAAVFWTWIWGPVGLVLSTPLTVCLVVLGQHVPRLRFLALLLGEEPALDPHVSYYQRLLAGDEREAREVAEAYVAAEGAETLPDKVLIPALLRARRDRQRAGLTAEDENFIFDSTRDILEGIRKRAAKEAVEASATADPATPAPAEDTSRVVPELGRSLIIGCPAHHRVEELVLTMLANSLERRQCRVDIISTRALPSEIESRVAEEDARVVFVAIVPPGGVVQARYLCRRLHRKFPHLVIIVGYWGRTSNFDRLLVHMRAAGASYVTTSLLQSQTQIWSALSAKPPVTPSAPEAPSAIVSSPALA